MPWLAAGIGLYQSISGGIKKKKAEKKLEAMADAQQPSSSIMDYYGKALSKYSPNPYQSETYQQQNNQVQRNLATGISAAQNKRLGLGAIAGQVQQANDASARAVSNAEMQSGSDLARLGQAAGMKTQEQQKKFDMMYNLAAAKAGAYAQTQNTGISNLYGGLSNGASMYYDEDATKLRQDRREVRQWDRSHKGMERVPRATF